MLTNINPTTDDIGMSRQMWQLSSDFDELSSSFNIGDTNCNFHEFTSNQPFQYQPHSEASYNATSNNPSVKEFNFDFPSSNSSSGHSVSYPQQSDPNKTDSFMPDFGNAGNNNSWLPSGVTSYMDGCPPGTVSAVESSPSSMVVDSPSYLTPTGPGVHSWGGKTRNTVPPQSQPPTTSYMPITAPPTMLSADTLANQPIVPGQPPNPNPYLQTSGELMYRRAPYFMPVQRAFPSASGPIPLPSSAFPRRIFTLPYSSRPVGMMPTTPDFSAKKFVPVRSQTCPRFLVPSQAYYLWNDPRQVNVMTLPHSSPVMASTFVPSDMPQTGLQGCQRWQNNSSLNPLDCGIQPPIHSIEPSLRDVEKVDESTINQMIHQYIQEPTNPDTKDETSTRKANDMLATTLHSQPGPAPKRTRLSDLLLDSHAASTNAAPASQQMSSPPRKIPANSSFRMPVSESIDSTSENQKKRFVKTFEALQETGLMRVTIKTAKLLQQTQSFQKRLDELKMLTQNFLASLDFSAGNNNNNNNNFLDMNLMTKSGTDTTTPM